MDLSGLLNMSRTSKGFRNFIMAPAARRLWKTAMANTHGEGYERQPPCPEWLSLPAYANLLYSPHCHASDFGQPLTYHLKANRVIFSAFTSRTVWLEASTLYSFSGMYDIARSVKKSAFEFLHAWYHLLTSNHQAFCWRGQVTPQTQ